MSYHTCPLTIIILVLYPYILNAFAAPGIGDAIAVAGVLNDISGDSVAVGISNHFSDADFIKNGDPYIAEGSSVPARHPQSKIYRTKSGHGGGYEDATWNYGGTQGLVSYKVTDTQSPYRTYCIYIMWSQYGFRCNQYSGVSGRRLLDEEPHFYFNGFGIAINYNGCYEAKATVFSNWKNSLSNCYSSSSGTDSNFGGSTSIMKWQRRSVGSSITINSKDSKITINSDMNPNSAKTTLSVEVGPYAFNSMLPPTNDVHYQTPTEFKTNFKTYLYYVVIICLVPITAYNVYKLMGVCKRKDALYVRKKK
eukprot:260639_1